MPSPTDAPIYLDHSATSPLRQEALEAMLPYLKGTFGNASSVHSFGREARQGLTRARREAAELLGVERDEVVFTGNGSEANLLALRGAVAALPPDRRHVLTTPVEHASVQDTLHELAAGKAIELETLPVDASGRVTAEEVGRKLRPETGLLSVMLANNELGTLQPVAQIATQLAGRATLLHCDACQAVGRIPLDLGSLGAHLTTISPHKFGGPKGVGILIRRGEVAMNSPLSAGRQEHGLRGGTEDVASCVGAVAALKLALADEQTESLRLSKLAGDLRAELLVVIPNIVVHSPIEAVLPGLINFSIPGIRGDWLVAGLDQLSVAISHGSACSTRAALPSHVLQAVGAGKHAEYSVRVSMGRGSSRFDVTEFLVRLRSALAQAGKANEFLEGSERHNTLNRQSFPHES